MAPLTLSAPIAEHAVTEWPKPRMRWGTAFGAWGDCLLSTGVMSAKLGHGGLIVYSKDEAVADFLSRQLFVDDVRYIKPASDDEYIQNMALATSIPVDAVTDDAGRDTVIESIAKRAGLPSSLVTRTHIDQSVWWQRTGYPWPIAASLSKKAHEWADFATRGLTKPFILVQPYSFNSSPFADHWEHWQSAVNWLATSERYQVVLAGHGWSTEGESPNVLNLVGKSPSMESVFALATRAALTVTTANGLSHFCAVQKLPAIVAANAPMSDSANYFRHALQVQNIAMVEIDEPLHVMVRAFRAATGDL